MITIHFTVSLQRRRDVLLARYRARQLAGLLDMAPLERLRLTGAVFELATAAYEQPGPAALRFEATGSTLTVAAIALPGTKVPPPVHYALPPAGRLPCEDVGWAMQQLVEMVPFHVFEDMRAQNRDLQWVLQDMAQPVENTGHRGVFRSGQAA